MSNYILETQQICKFFSQNQVLHDISFQLKSGEIMALMGENGAGKSTLIKIITGCYSRDSGKVLLDGREIHPKNTFESQLLGIQSVYQELDSSPSNGQRKKVASCCRIETATGGFLYGTKVHKGGAIG